MNRNIIQQFLGRNVEIMMMPDGRKTSGVILRCEDDFFTLGSPSGEAIYVYPIVWGINPLAEQPMLPSLPASFTAPAVAYAPPSVAPSVPIPARPPAQAPAQPENITPSFTDELEECYDDLDAKSDSYILNTDYVRKFRKDRMDKIQSTLESILTKYDYAVRVHEDRPYSMRMRQILDEAKNLWRSNQTNTAASEIYGFVLYLMGENARSVKTYMNIHDFRAAFTASTSAASRMLAAACLIVSEPITPRNFSVILKLEPPQVNALLRWIITSAVTNYDYPEDHRELCFRCVCSAAWKLLGYSPENFPEKSALHSQANIDALKEWLESQPSDTKIIDDAVRLSDKANMAVKTEPEKFRSIDWQTQRFEGDFDYFNPNRDKLYGFIKCPILKKYNVPLRSEGSVFIHLNQIEDRALRRKLLTCGKMKPMIRVTFRLGNNIEGPAAYDVKEKTESPAALSVDVMSALSEEGEIDFFMRYNDPPFGKVRAKDSTLYTFNEKNIIDPVLAVFLEVEPSAEGHPVRFTKSMNDSGKIQIQNVESAVPFPEEKLKAWENSGMIQKARERLNILHPEEKTEAEKLPDLPADVSEEIEELVARGYVPLEAYTPETKGQKSHGNPEPKESRKPVKVETFGELPKFLQGKILATNMNGKYGTPYLSDTHYSAGHFREVRANYLAMVSSFNSDDTAMTNAERAERCFIMARYVYSFFMLADEDDKKQYPASEEDNIRIMAYKGLEYLLYSQLDGAKKDESNYDTARRYCLLKIADEIQESRKIDENNAWLRIYIYSYFVNGLRFHSSSGKWSAQNVSLSGCSLLEFNDFGKFFEGLLTLAYVTEADIILPTLKALLHNLEYSGSLLSELGLDAGVYSQENADAEILAAFKKKLDGYNKGDTLILDAEVKLSPEILRILSVQKMIVRLMKDELSRILNTVPENLDDALKKANPMLATEEYMNSLEKTKRKYNPDAGLLDVLPINALGAVMRQYWNECFGAYFGGKPYSSYWKEKFAKLQWVRDPIFHAHPEYIRDEDIDEAKAVCIEIAGYLGARK